MPFVSLRGGRIQSVKLEYNLVDHCNYTCADCSHFSPWLAPRRAALDVFRRDLAALSEVYHVRRFRFVGGEPFLHPDLLDFVRAVRASGIADTIQICSNGSLVKRVNEAVFAEIDQLSISWYPDPRTSEDTIALILGLCEKHHTKLKVERIDRFREMRLDQPVTDSDLLQDLYDTCQIAHSWYCQTFAEGRFYLCSRPLYTGAYLESRGIPAPDFKALDGVPLHEPGLRERLLACLRGPTPPAACAWCLGTVGLHRPWHGMDRAEQTDRAQLSRPPEQHIDRQRLRYLRASTRLERAILRRLPSLSLARALTVARNLPVGD